MKRFHLLAAALAACILLSSCAAAPAGETVRVPVYVTETEGVYVVDNGQCVEPGGEVSFRLNVSADRLVTGASGGGSCTLVQRDGQTILTVSDVRYPTRVRLRTEQTDPYAQYTRTVTYQPNGGEGEPFSLTASILVHLRPNTARGGFTRPGHTLTGWNTRPDGTGEPVGLGSRVTVPEEGLTLYAYWSPWTDPAAFTWEETERGARITGCHGQDETLTIPAELGGLPVTDIGAGAFQGCAAASVILPPGLAAVEDGAFEGAALRTLTLFDDVERVGDGAFEGCTQLATLHINAVEDPYGYSFRRESLLADKADLLIASQGQKKLVFYGGCSVWYNLIGSEAERALPGYRVVNMGLNGTVNSRVQMEIIEHYLEPGDIFFHAPELSSRQQLMTDVGFSDGDDRLWCGLEYNYDLLALADLRGMPGLFDSLAHYLAQKQPGGSYADEYRDESGVSYLDHTGGIPFLRTQGRTLLGDAVTLDPELLSDGLSALGSQYRRYEQKGARVYISCACVNTDALPPEQRDNVELMDTLFHETIAAMDGPAAISRLSDYLFTARDFYDTHYHLLTQAAYRNTELWLRDLRSQMALDGLLP